MAKRILIFFTFLVFILEASMHYYFNISEISKPPSSTWSKEVLIDSADIQNKPSIMKFKENNILAYNNGDALKIIVTDNYGKKISEKTFAESKQVPYDITLCTDDSNIYLSYTLYNNTNNIETLILDENLNLIDKNEIKDITKLINIDKYVMVVSYKDKIEVRNIKTKSVTVINVSGADFLMGTKFKDNYVVGYSKDIGKYYYSFIKDDEAEEPKYAGKIDPTSKISFFSSTMVFDDKIGYILSEYRSKGEFGGAMELKFSLETGEFETGPFKINGDRVYMSDISTYMENDNSKLLVSTYIRRGKKKEYLNIAELNMKDNRTIIPVSKVSGSAIYPAYSEDEVIFCKPIEKGKVELYMASKDPDFIAHYSGIKQTEMKEAAWETLEKVLNSLAYILIYGILWIVPAVVFNCVSFLFEYRPNSKLKSRWYFLSYAVALGFKIYFINNISYSKYKYYMPDVLSLPVGILLTTAISIFYCIYGYKKYSDDVENNIMILHFFFPLLLDTIVTLVLFVPFIV